MTRTRLALVGNPNCGKTALFNLLTGARQKVANYAGATVERKEGALRTPSGLECRVLDLPGTYSLSSLSEDERVTLRVLRGEYPGEQRPDLLLCVAYATNLRLHLRFVLELQRYGIPMIVVLNMADAARKRGIKIDQSKLSAELGVPVVSTVAVHREGAAELLERLDDPAPIPPAAAHDLNVDLHQRVRQILAASVESPQLSDARVDEIDRWLIHPLVGPVVLLL